MVFEPLGMRYLRARPVLSVVGFPGRIWLMVWASGWPSWCLSTSLMVYQGMKRRSDSWRAFLMYAPSLERPSTPYIFWTCRVSVGSL